MRIFIILFMALSVSACIKPQTGNRPSKLMDKTYLALGDSYTVGEAVRQEESFPYQLVAQLNLNGVNTRKPKIIAYTGWTTRDLISAINQKKITAKYDFVTLLIGVNNQYMKYPHEVYRKEFTELLNTAISHSKGGKTAVFLISIPDWGVTDFGKLKNPKVVTIEIDKFNAINKEEASNAGVHYIDITPDSRLAVNDTTLISIDGLHPSGKMYAEWVKQLLPLVRRELY